MASKPCGTCGSIERYKSGNCASCSRAATARYRETEHGKKKTQEYLELSKTQRKGYFKEYRQTDSAKAVQARYRKTDKRKRDLEKYHRSDKYKQTSVRYRRSSKGKATASTIKARRRALESGADGSFTPAEWIDLCDKYENRCLCCGCDDVGLTVDHVIPLVKGGANNIENLQPLCFECNRTKWTDTIDYRVGYGL